MKDWSWILQIPGHETGFAEHKLKPEDVTPEFRRKVRLVLQTINEAEKTVHSKQLEKDFNLSGSDLRKIIRFMRFDKQGICSSKDGYSIARKPEDLDGSIQHMIERAKGDLAVALALKETQDAMWEAERQKVLFEQKISG